MLITYVSPLTGRTRSCIVYRTSKCYCLVANLTRIVR